MAEKNRPDEQTGEHRKDERPNPGHPVRSEDAEGPQRFRLEIAGLDEPRRDVGGEEQVIELERPAERYQGDQHPDVPRHRQPVEPGCEFAGTCAGHSFSSHLVAVATRNLRYGILPPRGKPATVRRLLSGGPPPEAGTISHPLR